MKPLVDVGSVQVFVSPHADPELIKALDLGGLAAFLARPMVIVEDTRRHSRAARRAYRERNLKPWERTP